MQCHEGRANNSVDTQAPPMRFAPHNGSYYRSSPPRAYGKVDVTSFSPLFSPFYSIRSPSKLSGSKLVRLQDRGQTPTRDLTSRRDMPQPAPLFLSNIMTASSSGSSAIRPLGKDLPLFISASSLFIHSQTCSSSSSESQLQQFWQPPYRRTGPVQPEHLFASGVPSCAPGR